MDTSSCQQDEEASQKQQKKRKSGASAAHDVEEGPACLSCRKKKAKCSREQPCSQCVRFRIECVYDESKQKPGLRIGAVENLSQRVVALENMFLGQGMLWQQVWKCLDGFQSSSTSNAQLIPSNVLSARESLKVNTDNLKELLLSHAAGHEADTRDQELLTSPAKRQRASGPSVQNQPPTELLMQHSGLPSDDLMDELVNIYFDNIHPWIPILHVITFRQRMNDPNQRPRLTNILHAIVSLCVRFSTNSKLKDPQSQADYAKRSKQIVILQSMESFSVENLQALVIIAFDTIGSGRGPSAWSVIGSMTRTVEQLQLSVEDEVMMSKSSSPAEFLMHRIAFLKSPESWIEREERRRVFWNVFLMDRFCSITTGWNFSLTSVDVKRRLPVEGKLWELGKEVTTPYFGVVDKFTRGNDSVPPKDQAPGEYQEDRDAIGGFGYCIEATESLSLVTMFFLEHAVNYHDVHDVQMWLMRFKELDLRLIQWKLYLPPKWREASVLNADGIMDPNLTLSHITHNCAVGLLHQGIAYPSPQWRESAIRFPSASSAETCVAAASEISIIATKFLHNSTSPTNPQFAFCLFISARMLLAHSAHYDEPLKPEFNSLVESLQEIARRWAGPCSNDGETGKVENLASKFVKRLSLARSQGHLNTSRQPYLDIRRTAYEEDLSAEQTYDQNPDIDGFHSDSRKRATATSHQNVSQHAMNLPRTTTEPHLEVMMDQDSPDSISLAFPPLPFSFQTNSFPQTRYSSPTAQTMHFSSTKYQVQSESPQQPKGLSMTSRNRDLSNGTNGNMFYSNHAQVPELGSGMPVNTFDMNTPQSMGMVDAMDNHLNGLEDLNSFFDQTILPRQRISMYED